MGSVGWPSTPVADWSDHAYAVYWELPDQDQWAVSREIDEFRRAVALGGGAWARKYKKMALPGPATYELRTTKSHRVLMQHLGENYFVIVEVSRHRDGHDVTADHSRLSGAQRARRAQSSGLHFAGAYSDAVLREYEGSTQGIPSVEAVPSQWILDHDAQQEQAVWSCLQIVEVQQRTTSVIWVQGGPGTGKTVVLSRILKLARELLPGLPVSWHSPKPVVDFLRACRVDLPPAAEPTRGSLVLVDDPHSQSELEGILQKARTAGARAVVVAFDPLQFECAGKAGWLSKLQNQYRPRRFELTTCYRQHGQVGRAARDVSTAIYTRNSKFIHREKVNKSLADLRPYLDLSIDQVRDRDDLGLVRVHKGENWAVAWVEQARRVRARQDLWTGQGWPPLAVICEAKVRDRLTPERKRMLPTHKVIDLAEACAKVRGQEFQEVWILLSEDSHRMIEKGRYGLATAEYEYLTNLHLAYSRAKDAVVTFVG